MVSVTIGRAWVSLHERAEAARFLENRYFQCGESPPPYLDIRTLCAWHGFLISFPQLINYLEATHSGNNCVESHLSRGLLSFFFVVDFLSRDHLPLFCALSSCARGSFPSNMPVSSPYPPVDIPDVDLWSFLFERKDRPFPDDKSKWIWRLIWGS